MWGGYADEATGYIPPVFTDYAWSRRPTTQSGTSTSTRRTSMLDEAGLPEGRGRRSGSDKQGKPLNLRLLAHAETNLDDDGGPFIKGWLEGHRHQRHACSRARTTRSTRTPRAATSTSRSPAGAPTRTRTTCCRCRPAPTGRTRDGKGGTPDSFLCDQDYDDLYAQQLPEFDPAQAGATSSSRCRQRLYDQATLVILGYDNALEAYRKDAFEGFPLQPADERRDHEPAGLLGLLRRHAQGAGPVPTFDENGMMPPPARAPARRRTPAATPG